MAPRVRLQVLDGSLPEGVSPCCGNRKHARLVDSVDAGNPYRVAFSLRCRLQVPAQWMPLEKDVMLQPGQMCAPVNDLTFDHDDVMLWVKPEFACISWEPMKE